VASLSSMLRSSAVWVTLYKLRDMRWFRWVLGVGGAVLAVSAAVAQPSSSIRIYGIIDTGLAYAHVSRDASPGLTALSGNQVGMASGVQSGSRWGLRVTETLAQGWVVRAVLEGGLDSATGQTAQGGRGFGRQATLAIAQDDYFDLQFGRQLTVSTLYLVPIDPLNLNFGQANMGASFGWVNTVRYDNLVQLQTGIWNGFRAGIGYSFNTGQTALYETQDLTQKVPATNFFGSTANMRALTAALQYNEGPWDVALTYDRVFGADQLPSTSGTGAVANPDRASPWAWLIGASYDFGAARVAGAFGQSYDGAFMGQAPGHSIGETGLQTITEGQGMRLTPGFDAQSAVLGVALPVAGPDHQLMVSWQMMQPKGRLKSDGRYATQHIVGAAYTYALSTQTNLYVWGSWGTNFQMIRSAKSGVVGTGVRHLF
jgi:GBP family porin